MKITIQNSSRESLNKKQIKLIKKVVVESFKIYRQKKTDLSIYVVNNSAIRKLNYKHRGKNRFTDVLSFPMRDKNYLGDIIFSIEKAHEQSILYGHTFEREMGFFIAHSMLHMFGYEHGEEMFKLQEKILQKARLYR
ncbi:MAG: rRNA maturation RNase YbeY [Defluviitaleaceae bacterium]|nr:rRNA maturation RNase YbeY [Defluviitaleaceae bacterium]